MLSLSAEDLRADAPIQVLSSGLPFLYVAVNSLDAIRRIRLRQDKWAEHLAGKPGENIFATTTETVQENSTVHSRMFAPALGINEDPATGSASGPLGAYLLKYGLVQSGDMVSEQGFEIGRPSFLRIALRPKGDSFSEVAVGGACAYVGYGTLCVDLDRLMLE